ncbi:MAG: tRNA (adenosine(37)-N6)-dimethylallyltransferase MiaA [Thermoguttaceae bacterium]|nr:tRNA (adenosine(37)-N6)-dimethylallyltransferase MiaA [Thermoguttaceae bacterium]
MSSARKPERSPFASSFFLTGATASGKTSLGVELARRIGAEIVSLDSMTIYRDMDVGTAKPTLDERRGVPHHMIDVVDPSEEYSVVEYMRQAARVVGEIESRGGTALFVGGTPLYLKTILFGVFDAPGGDPELRDELRAIAAKDGADALWERLRAVDPKAAEKLHPNDVKRVIRALEVFQLTGKPISDLQTQFSAPPLFEPERIFILTWERPELYARIERRVDAMLEQGFLEETRALFEGELKPGPTASRAVGYRELHAVLRGELSLEEAVERIKRLTRNFAKRQETWFRSLTNQGARRICADGKTRKELCDELEREIDKIKRRGESTSAL